jgi:hypothetical protein
MTIMVVTRLAESNDLSAFRSTAAHLLKKHGAVDTRIGESVSVMPESMHINGS